MKSTFIILATVLVLGSSVQAFQNEENSLFPRPTNEQRLKKLTFMLSQPKFNLKENVNSKALDQIFDYIAGIALMSPEEQLRAARSISEMIKGGAKKIKDVVSKIKEPFEKVMNKLKDVLSKFTKPIKDIFG